MSESAGPSDDWKKFYETPPADASTPEAPYGPGAPKQPRSAKPWIIGSLVVLVAVAATRGVASWILTAEPTPSPTPRQITITVDPGSLGQPTAPQSSASADPRNITVAVPDKLGGRSKSTDAHLIKTATDLEATMHKVVPSATSTASAFYGSQAKKNLVMIIAVSSKTENMDGRLGLELTDIAAQPGTQVVTVAETVEAGPLGGVAKCGELKVNGIQAAVCGWADGQSMGLVVWYFKGLAKARSEFATVRGQIEKVV